MYNAVMKSQKKKQDEALKAKAHYREQAERFDK
jgi:hypothetical protein